MTKGQIARKPNTATQSPGSLFFQDGQYSAGRSFGAEVSVSGEVVFATGMVGYPESLTDPSYQGQILVLTYPLIGNYGVPGPEFWESNSIKISGLVVSNYIDTPSHYTSRHSLASWLKAEGIPALEIKDTRLLTQKLREAGVMLGKIVFAGTREKSPFVDPNKRNLVAEVSTRRIKKEGKGRKTVVLIDCGAKNNIRRSLLRRGLRVITVPWNYDFRRLKFHGLVISNGPGDPKMVPETAAHVRRALGEKRLPILGICLGHQILALAAGGDTKKLKFGHRGQNHPCRLVGTKRFYLTTQNHGFVVSHLPKGFKPWFINANDQTNEGMIHNELPVMSVQFHPEAHPGPTDTGWIFDYFYEQLAK